MIGPKLFATTIDPDTGKRLTEKNIDPVAVVRIDNVDIMRNRMLPAELDIFEICVVDRSQGTFYAVDQRDLQHEIRYT